MKIEIIKADSGKYCMHDLCKKEAKYVTPKGRIKKGTVIARIAHKNKYTNSSAIKICYFYYCRTCIDQILFECKTKLDSKLWAFS